MHHYKQAKERPGSALVYEHRKSLMRGPDVSTRMEILDQPQRLSPSRGTEAFARALESVKQAPEEAGDAGAGGVRFAPSADVNVMEEILDAGSSTVGGDTPRPVICTRSKARIMYWT